LLDEIEENQEENEELMDKLKEKIQKYDKDMRSICHMSTIGSIRRYVVRERAKSNEAYLAARKMTKSLRKQIDFKDLVKIA
jgi:cell fate regulator YaaT (PSP1 superfamily)